MPVSVFTVNKELKFTQNRTAFMFQRDRFLRSLENALLQHTTSACGWYRDRRGRSRVVSEIDFRLAVAPAPTSGTKSADGFGVAPAYAR